jgi:hypothetical protein
MKSIKIGMATLMVALSGVTLGSSLRPDTQEPQCLTKSDQKLLECLRTCEGKPEATARLCRKQCIDSQEVARQRCDKKGGFEIRLPGT